MSDLSNAIMYIRKSKRSLRRIAEGSIQFPDSSSSVTSRILEQIFAHTRGKHSPMQQDTRESLNICFAKHNHDVASRFNPGDRSSTKPRVDLHVVSFLDSYNQYYMISQCRYA